MGADDAGDVAERGGWRYRELSFLMQAANLLKYCAGGVNPLTGPPKVSWLVTGRCNSRCMHCTMWKRNDEGTLDEQTEDRLLHELRGMAVRHIAFSGGEMFLHERMLPLIRRAKSMGFVTSGNSNGLMLGRRLVEDIGEAGLDMLTLSLEGSSAEVHDRIRGVPGGHERVINAVRLLRERTNVRVFVNVTISPLNVHDLVPTFDLARELGVEGVSIQPMHADEIFSPAKVVPVFSDGEFEQLAGQLSEIKRRHAGLLVHPEEFLDNFVLFFKQPRRLLRYRCAAGYYFMMIVPDGSVYPCPVLFGRLGNVREKSLHDIWFSPRAAEVRRQVHCGKHPVCWLSCIAPMNILLSHMSTLNPSGIVSRSVLRHVKDNLVRTRHVEQGSASGALNGN
jgi:radical SAM protein with 4Fe4S-binding SPASM domain